MASEVFEFRPQALLPENGGCTHENNSRHGPENDVEHEPSGLGFEAGEATSTAKVLDEPCCQPRVNLKGVEASDSNNSGNQAERSQNLSNAGVATILNHLMKLLTRPRFNAQKYAHWELISRSSRKVGTIGGIALSLSACVAPQFYDKETLNIVSQRCGLALGQVFQDESEKRLLFVMGPEISDVQKACIYRWARRNGLKPVVFDNIQFQES